MNDVTEEHGTASEFVKHSAGAGWLQPVARLMPLAYANDALRQVMVKGESLLGVWDDILILLVIVLSARTAGRAKI